MKINVFSENVYEGAWLSSAVEKKAIGVAKKALKFYLGQILENSCLKGFNFDTISFDILYCDNFKTHEINKEYRGKDYPADIITFAIFADDDAKFVFDGEINLGEIVISLDKATNEKELFFLISHGVLHLLGFDHQNQEEYDFVIKMQNQALASF